MTSFAYQLASVAIVLGCAVGGGAIGICVAVAIGHHAQALAPQDPSAGSAADIVIATAPLGFFVGLIAGVFAWNAFIRKYKPTSPKGFEVITNGRSPGA